MEINDRHRLLVGDASSAGEARRIGVEFARSLGFDETDAGRVAIALTEAATNLFKHAGNGEILLQELANSRGRGVGFVAIDRGRGIPNLSQALRDGYSTAGTPGNGLGAIARQANAFDIFSAANRGTALVARFWPGTSPESVGNLRMGGLRVAMTGQTVCGDNWAVVENGSRAVLMMADGLGHGIGAAEASTAACVAFVAAAADAPAEILKRMHAALRPTRGAAVAVAALDLGAGTVCFAGVGNIAASILNDAGIRSLVSMHGTMGHDVRKFQEFRYPWTADSTIILNSDGLLTHWTLEPYGGLRQRDPAVVAAVLYRDFSRGTDDAAVLVVRQP